MSYQVKTPIALSIFVRYETTKKVFDVIRQAKPPVLLVSANGPRPDHPDDVERCAAARSIIDSVDWDCEVLKNYSETNLDVGTRLSSGYRWVFDTVEEAIVLEDDCLVDPSFFRFCDELLERYRDDSRIFSINAQNFQLGHKGNDCSYYFSRYTHSWGWASWRRSWKNYDFEMKLWPEIKANNLLSDILITPEAVRYWEGIFQAMYDKRLNSWDYAWIFTCWLQSGLNITPNVNLVSNLGIGPDAVNFKRKWNKFVDLPAESMQFPLKHPQYMIRDHQADDFTQKSYFQGPLWTQFKNRIKELTAR